MRGRRPSIKVIPNSSAAHAPLPFAVAPDPSRKGMVCPRTLKHRERLLWERYIVTCAWLVSPYDEPKALRVVALLAEAEVRASLPAAKETMLRALLTDLGLDPAARVRLAGREVEPKSTDPAERFFDD